MEGLQDKDCCVWGLIIVGSLSFSLSAEGDEC